MLKVLKSYVYLSKSSLAALFLIVTLLTFTTKVGQAEAAVATLGMQVRQQAELLISSVKNTATAIFSGSTAASTGGLFAKENLLDGLAWAIAKQVASDITRSLIDWVNSGFAGSPAFVTDLEGLLVNSADKAVGQFIDDELGEFGDLLCSPFALDVRIALSLNYSQARSKEPPSCTLTGIENNLEGFLQGTVDSWDQWFQVTSNPQNTPYGAYLEAESEMYARVVDAQGKAITEANWGDGFLSKKICENINNAFGGGRAQTDARYGATQGARAETAATPRDGKSSCVISTPGEVISAQINKSLGLGQDALIEADEINELIGALISQVALQAVRGINGLLGLSGGTGYTDYGYSDSTTGLSYTEAMELQDISLDFSIYRTEMTTAYNRELGFLNLMNTTRITATALIAAKESEIEELIAEEQNSERGVNNDAEIALAEARIVELQALVSETGLFATSTASSAAALLNIMQRYDTATGTASTSLNSVRRDIVLEFVRLRSQSAFTDEVFIETKRLEWSRIIDDTNN